MRFGDEGFRELSKIDPNADKLIDDVGFAAILLLAANF